MKKLILLTIVLCLSTGCANMNKSLIAGAGMGLATGAAIGNAHGKGEARGRSTRNGSIIGAVIGLGLGYLGYKSKLKKEAQLHQVTDKSRSKKDVPLLTQPKVKRVWVKDKIQGKRFIKGHWEYIIQEQSVWSQ